MANVLVEENSLTAIGNAIRGKTGSTDLILPGNMASAIEGISAGGVDISEYFTNTEKYGNTRYTNLTGSGMANITLPTNVQFEDIVFAVGYCSPNGGATSTSTQTIPFIYCPALYDHDVNSNYITSGIAKDCFGFNMGNYSSSYYHGVWLPDPLPQYNYRTFTVYRPFLCKKTSSTETSVVVGAGCYMDDTVSSSPFCYTVVQRSGMIVIYKKV